MTSPLQNALVLQTLHGCLQAAVWKGPGMCPGAGDPVKMACLTGAENFSSPNLPGTEPKLILAELKAVLK